MSLTKRSTRALLGAINWLYLFVLVTFMVWLDNNARPELVWTVGVYMLMVALNAPWSVSNFPERKSAGPLRAELKALVRAHGLLLCTFAALAGTVWTIFYHQPPRWAALSIAVVGALILTTVAFMRPPPADEGPEDVLMVPVLFGGIFWGAIITIFAHGDFQILGIVLLTASAVTSVLRLSWKRRWSQRPEPIDNQSN